jgi:uncharacterized protein YggU (UPF0235/DUF167 family)
MRLMVRAHPGASRTGAEWDGAVLHVRIRARAIEGAANRELIQAVADTVGVRRSAVSLVAGERSRNKIFEVTGLDPASLARLREPPA